MTFCRFILYNIYSLMEIFCGMIQYIPSYLVQQDTQSDVKNSCFQFQELASLKPNVGSYEVIDKLILLMRCNLHPDSCYKADFFYSKYLIAMRQETK